MVAHVDLNRYRSEFPTKRLSYLKQLLDMLWRNVVITGHLSMLHVQQSLGQTVLATARGQLIKTLNIRVQHAAITVHLQQDRLESSHALIHEQISINDKCTKMVLLIVEEYHTYIVWTSSPLGSLGLHEGWIWNIWLIHVNTITKHTGWPINMIDITFTDLIWITCRLKANRCSKLGYTQISSW